MAAELGLDSAAGSLEIGMQEPVNKLKFLHALVVSTYNIYMRIKILN